MIGDLLVLWDSYWPAVAVGFVLGVAAGWKGFRAGSRKRRNAALASGALAAAACALLWHGPAGRGEALAESIEARAATDLKDLEMGFVTARLERGPLKRTLWLTGEADTFQRRELPRYMDVIPGVGAVRWSNARPRAALLMPLIAEAVLLALVAFFFGTLLAYLIEIRRRANADRRW